MRVVNDTLEREETWRAPSSEKERERERELEVSKGESGGREEVVSTPVLRERGSSSSIFSSLQVEVKSEEESVSPASPSQEWPPSSFGVSSLS